MHLSKGKETSFQLRSCPFSSFFFLHLSNKLNKYHKPNTNYSTLKTPSKFPLLIKQKQYFDSETSQNPPMARLKALQFTIIFLAMLIALVKSEETTESRKLDESPPDLQNKCGSCPCNNLCNPPSAPPPPSQTPPPPPPPPPKKQPPSNYCPPPPSAGGGGGGLYPPSPPYIFINGPPGNLYPIDAYYSGSGRSFSAGSLPFLISCVLGLIAVW